MPSMGEERRGEAMQQREPQADAAAGDAATARDGAAEVRLDLWLWAARFFKTRSLAKQAVAGGKVEVDGQRAKPSRTLRGGEAMRVERAGELFEVAVLGLSDVRGPASVAQKLYAETEASRARREAQRAQRSAERTGYSPPETRPDKRARRLIRALGDIDAA
jgi:ribosome-associated heat shock protein Hsp15